MELKKMMNVFTEKQIQQFKSKLWWVADRDVPYLVKLAIDEDFLCMQVTDLKNLWICRLSSNVLVEQKTVFAKSLEVKSAKDLMLMFQSLLSTSDAQAVYTFSKLKEDEINFTFNKRIQIYDFKWTFKLQRAEFKLIDLICRQIVNPLVYTLEAQYKRIQALKKNFQLIERDYQRKMTEMQKSLYKSPLIETQQDWKRFIPKQEKCLLNFIKLDQVSSFLYKSIMHEEKKKQPVLIYSQKKNAVVGKLYQSEQIERSQESFKKQLEKERVRMKKQKVIDFI